MKIICDDAIEAMKQLPDSSVDAIITDPPYGTTQNTWDSVLNLESWWKEATRVTKPAAPIVMFCAQPFTSTLISSNPELFKYCWIWEKPTATGHLNAKKQPLRATEDIAVFYRKQCAYFPQMTIGKAYTQKSGRASSNWGSQISVVTENIGTRYPRNLLKFARDKERFHPTQKPVELMEYLLKTYVPIGGLVLDPFAGSGSTGVAAKNLRLRFIGIEADPKYISIMERRIAMAANDNEPAE